MQHSSAKLMMVASLGFAAGIVASNLPQVSAQDKPRIDLANKTFMVSIDEIKSNFVFAEQFKGSYTRVVKMSDGSSRTIRLTPMLRNGLPVVELNDNGGITFMGIDGTTTNGKLMIQLRDFDEDTRRLKEQGWKF